MTKLTFKKRERGEYFAEDANGQEVHICNMHSFDPEGGYEYEPWRLSFERDEDGDETCFFKTKREAVESANICTV